VAQVVLDAELGEERGGSPFRRVVNQDPNGRRQAGGLVLVARVEGRRRALEKVTGRRGLALDLYLLFHAGAAGGTWDVREAAMVWARMLELPPTAASETTISRNWSWLEKQKLIRSERDRRLRNVILLREDGSGRPFRRASGQEHGFFRLPYHYFLQRWHNHLRLAGKATLLICLAQKPIFTLRTEHASGWYGVSADTLQRGLDELRDLELLQVWTRAKKAPRARYGTTLENFYRLQGPFVRAPLAEDGASEGVVETTA